MPCFNKYSCFRNAISLIKAPNKVIHSLAVFYTTHIILRYVAYLSNNKYIELEILQSYQVMILIKHNTPQCFNSITTHDVLQQFRCVGRRKWHTCPLSTQCDMEIGGKLIFVMRGRILFDWTVVMNTTNCPPSSKFSVLSPHPRLYFRSVPLSRLAVSLFSEHEI
jgi:hypothetical protein